MLLLPLQCAFSFTFVQIFVMGERMWRMRLECANRFHRLLPPSTPGLGSRDSGKVSKFHQTLIPWWNLLAQVITRIQNGLRIYQWIPLIHFFMALNLQFQNRQLLTTTMHWFSIPQVVYLLCYVMLCMLSSSSS